MGIKHIFRYLCEIVDLSLFFLKESKSPLAEYTNARCLSDPHKERSQIGYVFTYSDTTISKRSVKQTMIFTSTNHSKILASHKENREYI